MAQMFYDVVPYGNGWAIVMTPGRDDAFASKTTAFDTAADLVRKLRFAGYSLRVRTQHGSDKAFEPGSALKRAG